MTLPDSITPAVKPRSGRENESIQAQIKVGLVSQTIGKAVKPSVRHSVDINLFLFFCIWLSLTHITR